MIGVYVRVSKEEQNVGEQVKQGMAYASSFFRVYRDEGVSASIPLGQRKGGGKLVEGIKAGVIKTVWVQRLDRLNRDTRASLDFWDLLRENQVLLVSGYEGVFDVFDGDKYFIYVLNSLLAERERMILIKRTNDGLARARREGKVIGGGKKGRKWKKLFISK